MNKSVETVQLKHVLGYGSLQASNAAERIVEAIAEMAGAEVGLSDRDVEDSLGSLREGEVSVAVKGDVAVVAYEKPYLDSDGHCLEGMAQGLGDFAKTGGKYVNNLTLPDAYFAPIFVSPRMLAGSFEAKGYSMEEFREANPAALIVTVHEFEHSHYALRLGDLATGREEGEAFYVPNEQYQAAWRELQAAGKPEAEAFAELSKGISEDIDALSDAVNGWAKAIGAAAFDLKTGELLHEDAETGYYAHAWIRPAAQHQADHAMKVGTERAAELRKEEAAHEAAEDKRTEAAAVVGFSMSAARKVVMDGKPMVERTVMRIDENGQPTERAVVGSDTVKGLDELTVKVANQAVRNPGKSLESIVEKAVKELGREGQGR